MAYCGGATTANASYLASKTGLAPSVALAWLKNECQSNPNPTNPLNILYYGTHGQTGKVGRFGSYSSTNAGLDHAAWLINHSAYYSIIRAAIKLGNPWAEAHAIELSPWAGGHYGGSSTRYGGIVRTLQAITGGSPPTIGTGGTGSGGTAIKPGSGASGGTTGSNAGFITPVDLAASLAKLLGIDVSTPLSEEQASKAAKWLSDNGYYDEATVKGELIGKTLTEWAAGHKASIPDPFSAVADAIGGFGDLIGKLAGFMVGIILIALGVFLYSKSVSTRVVNVNPVAS